MEKDSSYAGVAEGGIYIPSGDLARALNDASEVRLGPMDGTGFDVQDWQSFLDDEEQRHYDKLIGLLFDSGLSGQLRNEYLYCGRHLIGEIFTEDGTVYHLQLSDTSIEVDLVKSRLIGASGTSAVLETDGEPLDAHQVWDVFAQLNRESGAVAAWEAASSLRSGARITFGSVEASESSPQCPIAMPVETRRGKWSVEIWMDHRHLQFGYAVTDLDRMVDVGHRVSDALLKDFAEAGGERPRVSVVIEAMLRVAVAMRLHSYSRGAREGRWVHLQRFEAWNIRGAPTFRRLE